MRSERSAKNILNLASIGNIQAVLENASDKSNGTNMGERRTALILPPGMRRGAIQAAMCSALEDCNLAPDGFDYIVGASVGATNGRELLGGKIKQLLEIFVNDKDIFLKKPIPHILDFKVAEDMFRKIGADEDSLKSKPTQLYIGLRNLLTGQYSYLNAKDIDDTIAAVISSMSIYSITNSRKPLVNQELYGDPMLGARASIDFAKNNLKATDILILFCTNPFKKDPFETSINYLFTSIEHMIAPGKSRNKGRLLLQALSRLIQSDDNPEYYLNLFSSQGHTNMAGIYPKRQPLKPNETNHNLLQQAVTEAQDFTNLLVKTSLG